MGKPKRFGWLEDEAEVSALDVDDGADLVADARYAAEAGEEFSIPLDLTADFE